MDSIVPVQNKNFPGNGKKFTKVSRAGTIANSNLHWQFIRIWQSLWRMILESLYVNTSPFRGMWSISKKGLLQRNVQDLLADGKTPCERRFGEFEGPIIPFASMVEYYPTTARDQARLHQCGRVFFLDMHWSRRGIWEGDILIADVEELENLEASEIYLEDWMQRKSW